MHLVHRQGKVCDHLGCDLRLRGQDAQAAFGQLVGIGGEVAGQLAAEVVDGFGSSGLAKVAAGTGTARRCQLPASRLAAASRERSNCSVAWVGLPRFRVGR